jgi:drug/metabolite transporter (DMT)-like permease
MSRRWNLPVWLGFVFVLGGAFSYEYLLQFPITRDFPWLNFLLIGIGLALLALGLFRAFGNPRAYRGKVAGSILAVISVCLVAFFSYVIFYVLHQVPPSAQAPRIGEKAPGFKLPDQNGRQIALADLLSPNGAVLIFYRGHW